MTTNDHFHDAAPPTRGRTIRWASQYDLVVKLLTLGKERGLREETIRLASLQPGATVLDVGCGTGTLTLLAKDRVGEGGSVYGVDAEPEMIAVARQKAARQKKDVDFQVGVIEALPFPDATFDVVLSSLMYHHLPGDLKRSGLAEIQRVLKPGGKVLIVDIQRAAESSQHITLVMLAHHGMTGGVQDLLPLMKEIGYVGVQEGDMGLRPIGFVQGQRTAAP